VPEEFVSEEFVSEEFVSEKEQIPMTPTPGQTAILHSTPRDLTVTVVSVTGRRARVYVQHTDQTLDVPLSVLSW
jgi:hypothetical protein